MSAHKIEPLGRRRAGDMTFRHWCQLAEQRLTNGIPLAEHWTGARPASDYAPTTCTLCDGPLSVPPPKPGAVWCKACFDASEPLERP